MSAVEALSVPPPDGGDSQAVAVTSPATTPLGGGAQTIAATPAPIAATPAPVAATPALSPAPVAASAPTIAADFPAPVSLAAFGQPPAEAAVRWRIRAATIDNLLVYALYLVVCGVLHWRVATPGHLTVLLVLGVLYHLALESRDGQTVGKRRYGIRVVSLDDTPATPKAVAIRSVLRLIDSLPGSYLSGLISMVRTGSGRRQRIGDVVAGTKVVAVGGRAAAAGTPGWMLPTATIVALVFSVLSVVAAVEVGHQPLTSQQEAQFVAGCQNGSGPALDCQCVLTRLEADGYNTLDSLNTVLEQARIEHFYRRSGAARTEVTSDALACRR